MEFLINALNKKHIRKAFIQILTTPFPQNNQQLFFEGKEFLCLKTN
jgi:hypothetical protein